MNFFTKKSFIIFALIVTSCLFFNKVFSQITISGSTSQDGPYTSLTNAAGAFLALNGTSQTGRTITISITADVTTEAGTNGLTGAAGMWTTLTISPSGGGARTISGTPAAGVALINLDNADNVTIDGLNTGGNSLIIANAQTSTTAGTSTIRFINDATNNIIRNCTIKGASTSATNGVIIFSTAVATTTGNDNNLIDDCDIGPNGASLPANCIYSLGTSAKLNSGNSITNCDIHDFSATTARGIYLADYNTDFVITGNSFFQTAPRSVSLKGIDIDYTSGSGDNFTVSNNFIGGRATLAGGAALTISSASTITFSGIQLKAGTTNASTISNNVIKNIDFTGWANNSASSANFYGIYAEAGKIDVTGNILGDNSTGSVLLTINQGTGGASTYVTYIFLLRHGGTSGSISNNTFGSLTIAGSHDQSRAFYGIYKSGAMTADFTFSNNTIGNESTANSINFTTTAPESYVTGVYSATTGSYNIYFTGNTVANITDAGNQSTTSCVLYGILASDQGVSTITNNSVHDLTTATTNPTSKGGTRYLAFVGIGAQYSVDGYSPAGTSISSNSIYNMKLTSASVTPLTNGIFFPAKTTGTNTCSTNFIYNLESQADGTIMDGVYFGGSITLINNMIRLGYNVNGTSSTYAAFYDGLHKFGTGACNLYFNSVYIGGSNVNNVAANYSACFERDNSGSDICINNIFQNTRTNAGAGAKHYSIVLNATTTFTSNYNDLFSTTAANLGSYDGGTTPRDFTAWKTGTSQDANSVNVDANFVLPDAATPNLHINPGFCGVNDIGIVISGITTDYDGNNRATGTAATLTGPDIGADEYSGNIDPDTVMTDCSESILLTVAGLGAGTLQWQESDDNGTTDAWVNAVGGSGATTANYTTAALTGTIYFRVAVTNGGCTEHTNSVLVKIDPTITVQPVPTTACVGLPTSLSVTAEGSGLSYQWQISTTGAGGPFSDLSDAGVYSNVTTATLNISDATLLNGNYYRCEVTSCAFPVNSDPVLLTVESIATRYWAGAGTVLTGGTAGTDFNADGNWSTTGPTGAATLGATAPSTCTDVVFTVTNTNTITLSANTTINSLSMSHSGTNDVYTLGANSFTLRINGSTSTNITIGNGSTLLILNPGTGEIVYGGNTSFAAAAGSTYCLYSAVDGQGTITFKGNVSFNAGAAGTAVRPGIVYFDGEGNQSVANNQNTYFIRLGSSSTVIGRDNSPTVTITGNLSDAMQVVGNLIINGTSTLDLSTFTLNRSAAGGSLTLASGATMRLAGLTASSNYPLNFTTSTLNGTVEYYAGGGQTISRTSTPTNLSLTYNNLMLTGSGAKTLAANTTVNGTLSIGGTPATFALGGFTLTYGAAAKLKYNSSVEQTAATAEFPSPFTWTGGVEIANTSATGVNLGAARTINSVLTLTDGNLITTSVNLLTLADGATVSPDGGVSNSFVDGPLRKDGDDAFVFPTGDGIKWARIGMSDPGSTPTDAFTAQYLFHNPADDGFSTFTEEINSPLTDVSIKEYWDVARTAGTADIFLTLYLEDASGSNIDDCPDLTIAHWEAGNWEEKPGTTTPTTGSCPGSMSKGYITTDAAVSTFSPFTFGSKSLVKNLLPIDMLFFNAYPLKDYVQLTWSTATEINNHFFTIERSDSPSSEGQGWSEVAKVKSKAPAGNSSMSLNYDALDKNPLSRGESSGVRYYRLKQTDFDGKYSYSNIVAVNWKENEGSSLFVFPNPANNGLNIVIDENEKSTVIIYDVTGQIALQSTICNQQSSICNVDIDFLPKGVYFVSLSDGVETKHARFVKN